MWDNSTAAIYDAAVDPMARIFAAFDCDSIDIQGDGGFALYTGERNMERGHLVARVMHETPAAAEDPRTARVREPRARAQTVVGSETGSPASRGGTPAESSGGNTRPARSDQPTRTSSPTAYACRLCTRSCPLAVPTTTSR
jgi:hypothetical protein